MPKLISEEVGIALDMHGCPNRCRHCWIGQASGKRMTEDDLRWVVEQFRAFKRPGDSEQPWRVLHVSTSVREPDYSSDYRHWYALENELSDLPPLRADSELLSVWRLARDPEYAEWAYSIGVRVCQLSFFGLEQVTDWACRRRGAFRDLVIATERLLAAGIRPRWQWFFTKKIIPDLPGLIRLTEDLRLRERCEVLGGPFTLFMHCPSPDGEAWHLEHLRPTMKDFEPVPAWLREQSEKHIGGWAVKPEAEWVKALSGEDKPMSSSVADLSLSHGLWFSVEPNFDLYASHCETTPWFRLGNLKRDGLAQCLDVFENDRTPGLHALFHLPVSELARRYGRPRGRRIYDAASDMAGRWALQWARDEWNVVQGGAGS